MHRLQGVDHALTLDPVPLPIGISFFTFHALSYVVDVNRKTVTPQKNFLDMGLYIALFPQLVAGPIVRYHDISPQLKNRSVNVEDFALGVERFVFGLGKKVLLANPMGAMADQIFSLQIGDLSTDREWVYTGGESDWAPRQMTYVYQGGRLVHLDDPVGHMNRLPDSRTPSPTTSAWRARARAAAELPGQGRGPDPCQARLPTSHRRALATTDTELRLIASATM